MREAIDRYLGEVAAQWKSGVATEHSYRPALQRLLAAAFPSATVVNEPARIECGAPDILVRENGPARRPGGYVEAKDIGDGDLDGNAAHREQFNRYKAELANVVFTDYLDFHFYEDGHFVAKCRIADVDGSRIAPATPEELERFAGLLRHFAEVAPRRIASPSRLARLMAGKARLLARAVAATLEADTALESSLGVQMRAFRQWLVHDLDAKSFADVYAQTIVYGMFAARFHDATPENFSRLEAASLIPRTNPLLRRLFRDLDEYVDDSIAWIVDDLVALFAASDVAAILKDYGKAGGQADPLLHFYEDFLAAYNPGLRKQRGVWYTPLPVVRFIVRAVDAILRRDFALPAGLADASKVRVRVVNDDQAKKGDASFLEREMHRVQILDPATGTGTFLAEAVRLIRSKFAGQEGMWPGYVRDHLVPRLNGFEILMASYAMAHLKLDLLLGGPDERLRVFLTNSLEEFSETIGTLWAMELSNEAREADFIKRDCPVMVVMGNPPYSGESQNKGAWIMRLMEDYKVEPGGGRLKERNPKWLNDDYVKFIRMAQHYVERNGEGVVAFINPHGFLDNPTFRGMRWRLMRAFDEIYVLDLHGNAKKKETAPDGSRDENVFDIMQGVSINVFVKKSRLRQKESLATVHHAEVFGTREAKYAFLDGHGIEDVEWRELHPDAPYCFFVPRDSSGEEEYNKGFPLDELFPVNSVGVVTANDSVLVATDKPTLRTQIKAAFGEDADEAKITSVSYRPFDKRWLYYDTGKIERPRVNVMSHILGKDNIALLSCRQVVGNEWHHAFVADGIVDDSCVSNRSRERGYIFPLYLYSDGLDGLGRTPNLNAGIVAKIEAAIAQKISPEDIFHYIYGVLHMREYRERYREFLKVGFPRIPYPKDGEEFRSLAAAGGRLVAAHLLRSPEVNYMFSPVAAFPVAGNNVVEIVNCCQCENVANAKSNCQSGNEKLETGNIGTGNTPTLATLPDTLRIRINATQYFDNVPATAWELFVGGYQPAQKWLKDRKGRTLSTDEILHYKKIVLALAETAKLLET
ncbi:MAG: N-6 DNA methylase [Kiritimatiellae bacterium]|nr:N-6 DNA methylase [Kiritimatiellia bacterium]